MTRPIKFRAWMLDERKMYGVNDLDFALGLIKLDDGTDDVISMVDLMQYTGLKDSNDREIYEGDILKVTEEDENSYIAPVVWGGEDYPAFDLDMRYVPDGWDYEANILSTLEAGLGNSIYEVVGNIYENPELLEEQHD